MCLYLEVRGEAGDHSCKFSVACNLCMHVLILSCCNAWKPVCLSLQQKSLFALLLFLISSDCLCWDCHPFQKAPCSHLGYSLVNHPAGLHSHLEALKELLDLVMGHSTCTQGSCLAFKTFTLLTFSNLWKEAFSVPFPNEEPPTQRGHRVVKRSLNVQGWFNLNKADFYTFVVGLNQRF